MSHSEGILDSKECIFCGEDRGGGLLIMMNDALQSKHAINQPEYHINEIGYIDVIMKLEQPCNGQQALASCKYRQSLVLDDQDEFLKRQYFELEYQGKIAMLTQYYKFHSDIPRIIEPNIEKILSKYYDKKREYDYKKIKRLLKEEQGLSITSVQQSQDQESGETMEKKSRYSTLLDVLQDSKITEEKEMSDSKLLKDMCKQIEKVLPSSKFDGNFHIQGAFNNERIFQQYLKQEELRLKQKLRQRHRERITERKPSNRFNFHQLLKKGKERYEKQAFSGTKESKEFKKKDKNVFNTNIKIQIKNAMFYSHGQHPLRIGNIEYQDKQQARFRKKSLINQINFLDTNLPRKKLIAQIYKSTQQNQINKKNVYIPQQQQRMGTKQSLNRSKSKNSKKSLPKKETSRGQLFKKSTLNTNSARKIIYANNQWSRNSSAEKKPVRSISSTILNKRSLSTNGLMSTASLNKKKEKIPDKRPIESISKYGTGSSDIRLINSQNMPKQQRSISIKDILNRKLILKVS